MYIFVLLLAVIPLVRPFSITESSASIGDDISRPAYSGDDAQSIELGCRMDLSPGEHWTSCSWSHEFKDIWGLTNSQGYIMCTVSNINDDRQKCEDVGNLKRTYGGYDYENQFLEEYVDRLSYRVTDNTCGLLISKPNANDTGLWKCEVNSNNRDTGSTKFWSDVHLYVANRSEVLITEPPAGVGLDQTLWADISDGQDRIEAACQSVYGVPLPEIVWYIDESTNRINVRDASISSNVNSQGDSVTSSISLDIDERMLGSYGVRPENGYFSFALGCYPNQGKYFNQNGYVKNPGEVMVFGKSGATAALTTIGLVLAQLVLLRFF